MQGSTTLIQDVSDFNSKNVTFNAIGVMGVCQPGVATNIDLKMSDDNFLSGGHLRVKNALFGDFINLQVVDVDRVLSSVQIPGQPTGVTYSMMPTYPLLNQFATNWFLSGDDSEQADFGVSYPAKIFAGLYIRIVYNSIALTTGSSVNCAMNYELHKALF